MVSHAMTHPYNVRSEKSTAEQCVCHRTIGDCLQTTVTMKRNAFNRPREFNDERSEFSRADILFRDQVDRKSVKKNEAQMSPCRWPCQCCRSVSFRDEGVSMPGCMYRWERVRLSIGFNGFVVLLVHGQGIRVGCRRTLQRS